MKKAIVIFLMIQIVCPIISIGQTAIIRGSIQGIGTDTIFVKRDITTSKTRDPEDTLIAVNGIFKYEFNCNEPVLLMLYPKKSLSPITIAKLFYTPDSKRIYLYVKPNDTIEIKGELTDYYMDYAIKGSDICQNICSLQKENKEIEIKVFKTELELDPLFVKKDKNRIEKLLLAQDSLRNILRQRARNYIKNNTNSDFSAYLLVFSGPQIIGEFINTLSPEVRNGMFTKYLLLIEKKYKNYLISESQNDKILNSIAPDFNLKSFQGENFILSNSKGKYVVLDFWATWCSPCIKGLPKMKEYYNKYKTRVEFVGIACNDKKDKWREFIVKNELPWINLLNNENEVPSVSSTYGAGSYLPTKVIIDPEGKIEAIVVGESEEFYNILDKILTTASTYNKVPHSQ